MKKKFDFSAEIESAVQEILEFRYKDIYNP